MKNLILISLMGYLPVALAEGPGATFDGAGYTNWQEERKVKRKPPVGSPTFTNWQNERRVKTKPAFSTLTDSSLQQQLALGGNLSVQEYIQGNANTISGINTGGGNESAYQNVFNNTIDERFAPIHDGSAPEGIPGAAGGFSGASR